MKKFKHLLMAVALLASTAVFAQTKLSGKVVDESNQPLPGASIVVKGTSTGTSSDFEGDFNFDTNVNTGAISISFVGYETKTINFNGTTNFQTIALTPSAESLDEVVIVGSGIIDLAEDRVTPIAVTTVKASEIQAKSGNSDLPEILKSTPSVQNIQGGGFGEGQMFLRGFDQTNTAFLLNGQPINGMEDGKMYWSNWSGVLDVANAVQVQRGLGSSKLAISSVGGTVNIVTKTIDKRKGGFLQTMVANDNYIKTVGYYSTGLMDNGFSVSALLGHWQGEGYVDYTDGQGQTYFLSFGYKAGENHLFNFLVTGAPQWHAVAGTSRLSDFLENGRRYNSWNYTNVDSPNTISNAKGGVYPGGRNIYHKPVANLSWDWNITDQSTLSSVLYGSLGRGSFASTSTSNGVPTYARGSNNNHDWYGLVTNYNNQFNENLNFNFGIDGRMYNGIHFRSVNEFISVDSVNDSSPYNGGAYVIDDAFGGINPWNILFNTNDDHKQRFHGYYDYEEQINYIGAFGQLEYNKNNFSTFLQGAISSQSHQRTEYGEALEEGVAEKSEKVTNPGFNVKAGASYTFADQHTIFANAGFYSRQPYHSDLFVNDRSSNQLNPYGEENQEITGLEAGYKFKSNNIAVYLNLYHTTWDNRLLFDTDDTNNDNIADVFFQSSPVKQVHMGGELEILTKPFAKMNFNGFLSIGNWEYDGNITTSSYDDAGNLLSTGDPSYIDGVKIGQAAQFTAGLNANYEILPRFSVDANWNYYDNLYGTANIGAKEFEVEDNLGVIELPTYDTVDAGISYKMLLGKEDNNSLQLRFNMNNVFDEVYLESARDNNHATADDETWRGINVDNRVRFGYGRTWNFSVRYNF